VDSKAWRSLESKQNPKI